jgi:hypothetical protein
MILQWSCFSASAGRTAFHPSLFRDLSPLAHSRRFLRGIPCFLDAAARGVTEFTADAASFKDSVDHCALTPLRFLSWTQKNASRFKCCRGLKFDLRALKPLFFKQHTL